MHRSPASSPAIATTPMSSVTSAPPTAPTLLSSEGTCQHLGSPSHRSCHSPEGFRPGPFPFLKAPVGVTDAHRSQGFLSRINAFFFFSSGFCTEYKYSGSQTISNIYIYILVKIKTTEIKLESH